MQKKGLPSLGSGLLPPAPTPAPPTALCASQGSPLGWTWKSNSRLLLPLCPLFWQPTWWVNSGQGWVPVDHCTLLVAVQGKRETCFSFFVPSTGNTRLPSTLVWISPENPADAVDLSKCRASQLLRLDKLPIATTFSTQSKLLSLSTSSKRKRYFFL